jgi:hypothetical protein
MRTVVVEISGEGEGRRRLCRVRLWEGGGAIDTNPRGGIIIVIRETSSLFPLLCVIIQPGWGFRSFVLCLDA